MSKQDELCRLAAALVKRVTRLTNKPPGVRKVWLWNDQERLEFTTQIEADHLIVTVDYLRAAGEPPDRATFHSDDPEFLPKLRNLLAGYEIVF